MRDLAFFALLVFLCLVAVGLWFGVQLVARSRRKAVDRAAWGVDMHTLGDYTTIKLIKRDRYGREMDSMIVGQVPTDHPDYNDKMLALEAQANERLSVVKSIK